MASSSALVTGATGGLGRTLVPALLDQRCQVVATGRDLTVGKALAEDGAHFIPCDLVSDFDPALVKNVQTVFHLAALSSPWGKPEAFEAVNVEVTQRLLDAAIDAGVANFVHVSTPSIYADGMDRLNLHNDAMPAKLLANDYARTKLEAEGLVMRATGIRRTIIRPRAIVGPHDTVLLPRLLKALDRPVVPLPREGRATIEITDVRDVADAVIRAASRIEATDGRSFNVSGGQPMELRALLALIGRALGREVRTVDVPTGLLMGLSHALQAGARLWPGQPEPPLTPYSVKTLAWSQSFDLSETKRVLDWAPRHSPEQAIAHALGLSEIPA